MPVVVPLLYPYRGRQVGEPYFRAGVSACVTWPCAGVRVKVPVCFPVYRLASIIRAGLSVHA